MEPHISRTAFEGYLRDGNGKLRTPVEVILTSEKLDEILSHVPADSTFIAAGFEAIVFKTPKGGVVRIGRIRPRLDREEMLQAQEHFEIDGLIVEYLPFVEVGIALEEKIRLAESLADDGYRIFDDQDGNFGRAPSGKACVIDPGSVQRFPLNHVQEAIVGSTHTGYIYDAWLGRVLFHDETLRQSVWYRRSTFREEMLVDRIQSITLGDDGVAKVEDRGPKPQGG
jgi:hypothetical protein